MPSLTERVALRTLRMSGWRSRQLSTSVGRVHVIEARGPGSLPPVVVLHGLGAAGVNYVPLLRRLRQHASEVVAIDMPGHGFSDVPRPGLTPETLRAGLREALDAVVDERRGGVALFGNSMGGFAVARYAVESPERVRAVVLCSPGGAMMDEAALGEMLRVFDVRTHADALAFVDRLLVEPTLLRHVIAWGVRRKFNEGHIRALVGAIRCDDLLRPEEVSQLTAPTLLIWGRDERILPPECLTFFRRHLPSSVRVAEPEGFGHTPHLERPGALTKQVVQFLHSVSGGPSIDREAQQSLRSDLGVAGVGEDGDAPA